MTATSDRDLLLRAVHDNPGERTPRLMLTDWLEENGDPIWAAYLRLTERNSTPRGPDATALTRKLTRRWKREYGFDKATKFVYINGFIYHVKTAYRNLPRVVELTKTHRVESVDFTEYRPGRNQGGYFFERDDFAEPDAPWSLPQHYLSNIIAGEEGITMMSGGERDYVAFPTREDAVVVLHDMFGWLVNDLADRS